MKPAVIRRRGWYQRYWMTRIRRCVPPDARDEVQAVLEDIMRQSQTDKPQAALLWLILDYYRVEVLPRLAAKEA